MWPRGSFSLASLFVEFVEGDGVPWEVSDRDSLYSFVPHQTDPLAGISPPDSRPLGIHYRRDIPCACQREYIGPFALSPGRASGREPFGMNWMDPRGIPTECLVKLTNDALSLAQSHPDHHFGIVIPRRSSYGAGIHETSAATDFLTYPEPIPAGRRVWYASLDLEPVLLRHAVALVQPKEIFPTVEFPPIESLGPETSLTLHMDVLEEMRVRTERVMHLNPRMPSATYAALTRSFQSLLKTGPDPRIAILTPGGRGPTVTASLLAGAVNRAAFVSPQATPFPAEKNGTWGFAVVRRRA